MGGETGAYYHSDRVHDPYRVTNRRERGSGIIDTEGACVYVRERKQENRKKKESIKRRFPTIGGDQQRGRGFSYSTIKEKLNAVRCLVLIKEKRKQKS